jgi:Tol biopolymer transport system component
LDRITAPAPPAGPGPTLGPIAPVQQLAFASNRDGNWEIYRVNSDGTGLINLTNSSATDGYSGSTGADVAWSPDGGRIAYTSDRSGEVEIYLMTADGAPISRGAITGGGGAEHDLAWSPDGSTLAFARTAPGASHDDVWTYSNVRGVSLVNRTASPDTDEDQPTWSADGNTIALRVTTTFVPSPCFPLVDCSKPTVVQLVATLSVSGGPLAPLDWAAEYGTVSSPTWSPLQDGPIMFVGNTDGDDDLHLAPTDGSPLFLFLDRGGRDAEPRWAPDGIRVAFTSIATGSYEVLQVDGAGPSAGFGLVQLAANGHSPSWAPDGARVAFVRPGLLATQWQIRPISSIYTVPAGGGAETLVVSGPSSLNVRPVWRPR